MSEKQYPDFNANPFHKIADKLVLPWSPDVAEVLKTMVNPDVCLTDEQQKKFTCDYSALFLDPNNEKLIILATLLNSYRTSCSKCLNKKCTMRDMRDV